MGGFKLYGPSHVFEDEAKDTCFCVGFVSDIDSATEMKLLMKNPKVLDPHTDLPAEQRSSFLRSHMPDLLSFKTRPLTHEDSFQRSEDKTCRSKAQSDVSPVAGFDGGSFAFAPFS